MYKVVLRFAQLQPTWVVVLRDSYGLLAFMPALHCAYAPISQFLFFFLDQREDVHPRLADAIRGVKLDLKVYGLTTVLFVFDGKKDIHYISATITTTSRECDVHS